MNMVVSGRSSTAEQSAYIRSVLGSNPGARTKLAYRIPQVANRKD